MSLPPNKEPFSDVAGFVTSASRSMRSSGSVSELRFLCAQQAAFGKGSVHVYKSY